MSHDENGFISRRRFLAMGGAAGLGVVSASQAAHADGKKPTALPQVPQRVLGKTGQKIPILLFGGSMKLDPRFDPKLAEAVRFGVSYIDAADCYGGGTCEPAVGAFHTRAKNRDKLWITSKSDVHDPSGFAERCERSLAQLKTNYIDLYFLHALQKADYLSPELEKTVAQLKKDKKIRFFGFSAHHGNVPELLNKAAQLPWIDAVMFRYNFRKYGDKELNAAMDAAHKANVGLIAMKTQGSEASFRPAWEKLSKDSKWTKHQAVLKAVWADPRITAAVSHMDTFEKLKQNIAAAVDKAELSQADFDAIHKYADATRHLACDGCDHLCGAAVDAPVQIGATMRYVMYHDVYGDPLEAQTRFAALPREAQRLEGVDFSGANAACPHGVDVAAHMARAREIFHA